MKEDIFSNNTNPFTVPDGYFDTLQERIMSRVQAEESRRKAKGGAIRMQPYRMLVAAAACILLVFSGVAVYTAYTGNRPTVAEAAIDEDFYQWFYASERTTLLAESLNIAAESVAAAENGDYEEDEAIICFLERENINVADIVQSLNNE